MKKLNKYEILILDKRELEVTEERVKYWKKFAYLPVEKLQPLFATEELQSKNKHIRKMARKDFVREIESHKKEVAKKIFFKQKRKRKQLKRKINTQEKKFNFLDKLIEKMIISNPNSRIYSPSFLAVIAGEDAVKGFMKGLNYGKNNLQ